MSRPKPALDTLFNAGDHYEPGDLVYGRAIYRADLTSKILALDKSLVTMCDDMNNHFIGTGDETQPTKQVYGQKSPKAREDHENSAICFQSFLENLAYKNGLWQPQKTPGDEGTGEQELRIKRACKAGILRTTSVKKKFIHFYLKGIASKGVTEKKIDIGNSMSIDPITSKELRWTFRHWKDPNYQVSEHVVFWDFVAIKGGIVVVPSPWDQNPNEWQQYADLRESKGKTKHW